MARYFLIPLFLFVLPSVAVQPVIDSTEEVKKDVINNIHPEVFSKVDMSHLYFVSGGARLSLLNLSLFLGVNTLLFDDSFFKDYGVASSEYQYAFIRNLVIEAGVMLEVIPFFGVSLFVFTKEFMNGLSKGLSCISGFRIGGFLHLSSLIFEGGILLKEGHRGFFDSWCGKYGVSLFIGAKFIKDGFYLGGGMTPYI